VITVHGSVEQLSPIVRIYGCVCHRPGDEQLRTIALHFRPSFRFRERLPVPNLARLLIAVCCLVIVSPATAQNATIGIEQFDSWIFQGVVNRNQARSTLESRIDLEIARISQAVTLTTTQKDRLKLAGYGDVKRFYDRVEKARQQFLALGTQVDQNNINEAYQLALPLQQELRAGLFGQGSLLEKIATTTLDDKQTEIMHHERERRNRLRIESAVKVFIAQLGRQMPMTAVQRTKLTELLVDQMRSIGDDDAYTDFLVAYRLSQVPRNMYAPLFDEQQLKALDQSSLRGKSMKAMLKDQGLLNDEQ